MIQFCTGIPGSGKSYFGMFSISINFAKSLKDNKKFKPYALDESSYKYCLTNINEIELNEFENVHSFVFNDFYLTLKKLHNFYKIGYTDTQLEDESKNEIFFNTLIVLDECQNYLNKDDEVLVWWLSYHRHFSQDVILITQDIPLVHKKYKSFTQFFYKAVPSSKKIFNTHMIYQQYTGYQMFQTQKGSTKKLPIVKDIFKLYVSGANEKQKSLILHFLFISFFFLIFFFIMGYFFISSLSSDSIENTNIKNKSSNETIKLVEQKSKTNFDGTYFEMFCNKNLCFINNNIYERIYIFHVLNKVYKTNFISSLNNKFYFTTNDEFNLFELKKRSTEDEKNLDINPFNSDIFGSK